MTDHAEEQEMEAEAMAAIFDTQFTVLETAHWSVTIYPESGDPAELDTLNHVGCKLLIRLPDTYPEVLPQLDIEIIKGLAEEQRLELKAIAEAEAEANIGVPSMFAVTERLREWLLENNVKGLDDVSMHAQMMRKKQQAEKAQQTAQLAFEAQKRNEDMTEAEREELEVTKRRAEGTPCTRENFESWQRRFLEEMAAAQAAENANDDNSRSIRKKEKAKDVDKTGRLTGYELFSNKMVNLEALEAAAEEAEKGFEGDEELFQDDVDLDDLDFDDDEEDDEDDEAGEQDEEVDI